MDCISCSCCRIGGRLTEEMHFEIEILSIKIWITNEYLSNFQLARTLISTDCTDTSLSSACEGILCSHDELEFICSMKQF